MSEGVSPAESPKIDWHRFEHKDELSAALAASVAQSLQTVQSSQPTETRQAAEARVAEQSEGESGITREATRAAGGIASLAVSGGSTPGPFFDCLAGLDTVEWARVVLALVDERYTDQREARNDTLVAERLLRGPAADCRFVPAFDPAVGLEARVAALEAGTLAESKWLPPSRPFDVLVLGMGGDAHTASLFPDAEGLERAMALDGNRWAAIDPPAAPHRRLTLSRRGILEARRVLLHITGQEKLEVLEQAMAETPADLPIARVADALSVPLEVWWAP